MTVNAPLGAPTWGEPPDPGLVAESGGAYASLVALAKTLGPMDLESYALPPTQFYLHPPAAVSQLLDACTTLCPSEVELPVYLEATERWIRWDRMVGYAFAIGARLLTQGTPLEGLASALVARAQLNFNWDRWTTNLDHAIVTFPALDQNNQELLSAWVSDLTLARYLHLKNDRPNRPYAKEYVWMENEYQWLCTIELLRTGHGELAEPARLRDFIAQQPEGIKGAYARAAGGLMLGIRIANEDPDGAVTVWKDALARVRENGITTETGHLLRVLGDRYIHNALTLGEKKREGWLGAAVEVLQQAVDFESVPGCEYWLAISAYRLADAHRYLGDVLAAHEAYERASSAFVDHLAMERRYLDRAIKRRQVESFTCTALKFASDTHQGGNVVTYLSRAQSDTGRLLAEQMRELRNLDDQMRDAVAQTRAWEYAEALAAKDDFGSYKEYLLSQAGNRLRAAVGKDWTNRVHPLISADELPKRLRPGTALVALMPFQTMTVGVRVNHEGKLRTALDATLTSDHIAALHDEFATALIQAKSSGLTPDTQSKLMRHAVDKLIKGLEAFGSALLGALTPADASRVLLVTQGLARDLPWHAVAVKGAYLDDRFEVVHAEAFSGVRQPSPVAGKASVSMVYDDQKARNYEVIAAGAHRLGIDAVLRSPAAEDVVALAPIVQSGAAGPQEAPSQPADPLYGHVLVDGDWLAKLLGASEEQLDELNQVPDEEAHTKLRDLLFAGHCDFDPQHPLLSGLRLSGNPMRFADVLAGMDMKEWRSVILAACESGLAGRALPAEEPGVASAFLASGVDYVVSTLWPVDKWASAVFVDYLLAALRKPHNNFPGAFRQAVRRLRELSADQLVEWSGRLPPEQQKFVRRQAASHPRPFGHPYFWAGYVLNGVG